MLQSEFMVTSKIRQINDTDKLESVLHHVDSMSLCDAENRCEDDGGIRWSP